MTPRVTDNDKGEIIVTLEGKELRGWEYHSDTERRQKMLMAREYVEGWHDCRKFALTLPVGNHLLPPVPIVTVNCEGLPS